jgi:endonuclease YncB( thermonuclease family)
MAATLAAMTKTLCLLAFLVSTLVSHADEPSHSKKWLTFTNCTYLEAKADDGDSFFVLVDGTKRMLRLYYVDCPESSDQPAYMAERLAAQAEHFGCTPAEALAAGKEATATVAKWLEKPFTVQTHYAVAPGRSRLPRYYAVLKTADGKDVGEELLKAGMARANGRPVASPEGEKAQAHDARLKSLEAEAKRTKAGLWSKTKAP